MAETTPLDNVKVDLVYDEFPSADVIDYGLQLLGVPTAWRASQGEGVKVGVVDTGWPDHQDVSTNLKGRYQLTEGKDTLGHGTHVCGIIAAKRDGIGLVGVAPMCDLYAANGACSGTLGLVRSLIRMRQWKVDVLNLSFGSNAPLDPAVYSQLQQLYQSGTVIVAAAGNTRVPGANTVNWPARYPEVIPAVAIGEGFSDAPFSATGPEVERGFALPGVKILSTWLDQNYARLSGTSMAAPFLTGLIALLIAKHRKDQGSTPIPESGPGRTQAVVDHLTYVSQSLGDPMKFGHGYIDASKL